MRIVDLSLPINARMAALPGFKAYDENPTRLIPLSVISPGQVQDLKQRGLQVDGEPEATNHMLSKLEITTHIGTHIDAPLHMLENTWSIDEVPLERLVKKGRVIPLTDIAYGGVVTADAILATGVSFDGNVIPVLHTGWTERMWGKPEFWTDTVWMHRDAAELVAERGCSAVAIDFFPEFPFWRKDLERPEGQPPGYNHKLLLVQQTIIIQMVTNVGAIGSDDFTLSAVPMKLEGLDGSPARVFAMVE
jgi:arylformamidase